MLLYIIIIIIIINKRGGGKYESFLIRVVPGISNEKKNKTKLKFLINKKQKIKKMAQENKIMSLT